MNILHEKFPCCQGLIRRFGNRRRQCGCCKKTWTVWKKKRGRKHLRTNTKVLSRYLTNRKFSFKSQVSKEGVRRRLTASLNYFLTHTSWKYPLADSDLIAVADGMHQILEGQSYIVYLVLLRPVDLNQAWIMPPLLVPGGESAVGWQQALHRLKPGFSNRIKALVCDGDPHLVHQARLLGWLIQRCHFHLLASIKNYVTAGPLSRHKTFGKLILETVQEILVTRDEKRVEELVKEIWNLVRLAKNPKLRGRLKGLIRNLDDFRTYLKYPKLNLPTTSNAAESLVQVIRDLQYRARGFRTKKSFQHWLTAICLFKKIITCNGKYQQKKHV